MKRILYFHGFASAGSTGTAIQMRNTLYGHDVEVISPDIPVMPLEALPFLKQTVEQLKPDLIIGTSMGAMYAEQMHGTQRILVNPSFHMARLLTFRGLGRREFRNHRADGAKDFKVDKEMIAQFQTVETTSFQAITPEEKELVWALFGKSDKLVNCQPDFKKHYGTAHLQLFDGDHYLNDQALKRAVMPLACQLLGL